MATMRALLLVALVAASTFADNEEQAVATFQELMQNPTFARDYASFIALRTSQLDTWQLGYPNYSCPAALMQPSATVPTSVHAVRPADIKIVATLGDSLSAANGAKGTSVLQILNQYRGVAFDAGGDQALEQSITLPNILRKYNPNLYGQSYGTGSQSNLNSSQLNVAVPASVIVNLTDQAVVLVQRLKNNPKVDYEKDWKLITIFYGGNDLCSYCQHKDKYNADVMAAHLRTVMTTLSQIPRAIVSLIGQFHVELLRQVGVTVLTCQVMHTLECPCSQNLFFTNSDFNNIVQAYQKVQLQFQASGEWERDDFTFVVQTGFQNTLSPPRDSSGQANLAFFAPDCFHFSQFGHNTAARFLWNNLLEPVGGKMTNFNLTNYYVPLSCPDPNCPYVRTTKNSPNQNCAKFMAKEIELLQLNDAPRQ